MEINLPTKNISPGALKKWLQIGLSVLVPIWLVISSVYFVGPSDEAVIVRFGEPVSTKGPGIGFKVPIIDVKRTVNVKEVIRTEIGYRTLKSGSNAKYQDNKSESLILTSDENVVDVTVAVQLYRSDPIKWLYSVAAPEAVIHKTAQSIIGEVIGRSPTDDVLTTGKDKIQMEAKRVLQDALDQYQMGVKVSSVQLQDVHVPDEVKAAYSDVNNAKEEKQTKISEAEKYRNERLPKARGNAAQEINAAEQYATTVIKGAEGEVAMFNKIYPEYKVAKEVTRTRLYLDMMETILGQSQIYIVDDSDGTVKYIPLNPTALSSTSSQPTR